MTRVLVTGAHGFLGSHMVAELERAGHWVFAVDKGDADITTDQLPRLVSYAQVDAVIHFAAQVGRQFCEDAPRHAIDTNVWGTMNVAQACERHGCQLVHISTSEVYGEHGTDVVTELTKLGTPTGVYALTKRWAEDAVREYGPANHQIVRPSMPYGAGAPPGRGRRALDNFLWQAHHSMPIDVHHGSARSWCWVGDTVAGIRLVMEKGERGGAYNVGRDDAEITMENLALMACELAGADPALVRLVDPPARQTVVKRLSSYRLRKLGWEPTVELDAGMKEVYAWVRQFDENGRRVGT